MPLQRVIQRDALTDQALAMVDGSSFEAGVSRTESGRSLQVARCGERAGLEALGEMCVGYGCEILDG
jgi:hypothetical protein